MPSQAFSLFVDSLRELWSEGLPPEEHWARVKDIMAPLLADEDLQHRSESWPVTNGTNLLFHEDAEHGFVVNAVKEETLGVDSDGRQVRRHVGDRRLDDAVGDAARVVVELAQLLLGHDAHRADGADVALDRAAVDPGHVIDQASEVA